MENKVYTAQEMREAADFFDRNAEMVRRKVMSNAILANIHEVILMLRQSAEALEREEKREKKYEYTQKYISVDGKKDAISRIHYETIDQADVTAVRAHGVQHITLRRPVGEWEEVSNG